MGLTNCLVIEITSAPTVTAALAIVLITLCNRVIESIALIDGSARTRTNCCNLDTISAPTVTAVSDMVFVASLPADTEPAPIEMAPSDIVLNTCCNRDTESAATVTDSGNSSN